MERAKPSAPVRARESTQMVPGAEDIGAQLGSLVRSYRVLTRLSDSVAYSPDAGLYQLVPQAVVQPLAREEIRRLFRLNHEKRIPLTFRAAERVSHGRRSPTAFWRVWGESCARCAWKEADNSSYERWARMPSCFALRSNAAETRLCRAIPAAARLPATAGFWRGFLPFRRTAQPPSSILSFSPEKATWEQGALSCIPCQAP
jgi:hypothetical protein